MTVQFTKVFEDHAGWSLQVLEYARKFELGAWWQPDGKSKVTMLPVRMDADDLFSLGKALQDLAIEHGAGEPKELTLQPVHITLLKRGANGHPIGLRDEAELHSAEVAALGELERAGFIREDDRPLPPGPPCLPPYIITFFGLLALKRALMEASHG